MNKKVDVEEMVINMAARQTNRPLREEEVREQFRVYFVKLKRKLELDPNLENVLWVHLKASGFNKKELFAWRSKRLYFNRYQRKIFSRSTIS